MVHGIPSSSEKLRDGDMISIDFGAIVDGWHGDAAITVLVGDGRGSVAALSDGVRALAVGRPRGRARRTAGSATSPTRSRRSIRGPGRYGIVAGYGGHGIGIRMHMDPHMLNYGKAGKGPRLTRACLAIEPMITLGSRATRELADGWTVATADGSRAAHWEHTVAILDDGPWVLTAEDGGRAELAGPRRHPVRCRRLTDGPAPPRVVSSGGEWSPTTDHCAR